jgi:hypothetical protein
MAPHRLGDHADSRAGSPAGVTVRPGSKNRDETAFSSTRINSGITLGTKATKATKATKITKITKKKMTVTQLVSRMLLKAITGGRLRL